MRGRRPRFLSRPQLAPDRSFRWRDLRFKLLQQPVSLNQALAQFRVEGREVTPPMVGENQTIRLLHHLFDQAGPPRVGEQVYSWTPADVPGNVSYLPTPGPGDSDGGDIY